MNRQGTYAETDGMNFISRSWEFLGAFSVARKGGSIHHYGMAASFPSNRVSRFPCNFDAKLVLMVDDVFVKYFDWSHYAH